MTGPAGGIPSLRGSLLFAVAAGVYLRHVPVGPGRCGCGQVPCHSRYHAITVIEAAGRDPMTITATDAQPRPWHERPPSPAVVDAYPPAASNPTAEGRPLAQTTAPARPATGGRAVASPAGGTANRYAVPPAGPGPNHRWNVR